VPQLRIALAQINTTVGDLTGNAAVIVRWVREAANAGAHLVAFPEMALTGYPVEDLALRRSFVDASRKTLDDLAHTLFIEGLGELPVIVGYLDRQINAVDRPGVPPGSPQDAAAVLWRGAVICRSAKHHLPNYGVFDERRHFVPGNDLPVLRIHGVDVAIVICEDLWQDGGPVSAARQAGAGLLIAINASPYERHKDDQRHQLVRRRSAEAGCPLAYVNLVGGQDELVFDGDSLVVDTDGVTLARGPQFAEACVIADLELAAAATPGDNHNADIAIQRVLLSELPLPAYVPQKTLTPPRLDDDTELYQALVLGLGDYVRKNGFRSVCLGISGGIDSALTTAIAVDALGSSRVLGVAMPSAYSSQHSLADAAALVEATGIPSLTLPIAPMVDALMATIGKSVALTGLAQENLQARVRGITLMALSNQQGHLVLATGNKSELSVGYSTIYGDAVGGFAPLKDVSKTAVWRLAHWRNAVARERQEPPPIPENSIMKPPSAELRPDQLDSDSLPAYDVLDGILDHYVERDYGRAELVTAGFDSVLVAQILAMTDAAEYKRRQYPPGTKISFKAFGRDRRLPITNRWRDHSSD
jgi:NAD+ synthase (glutamine-hydrolysing)